MDGWLVDGRVGFGGVCMCGGRGVLPSRCGVGVSRHQWDKALGDFIFRRFHLSRLFKLVMSFFLK